MFKRTCAFLLALIMVLGLFPAPTHVFATETGTDTPVVVDDPINNNEEIEDEDSQATATEIATVEALLAFAAAVNAGDNFAGKTVRLTADIDLAGIEWQPIGGSTVYFAGEFDGNEHTISNLTNTEDVARKGLFGLVEDCYIHDLTLKNVKFSGTAASMRVGALAGNLNNPNWDGQGCIIENVTVDGLDYDLNDTDGIIGGLIGYSWNSHIVGCTVKNADMNISSTADSAVGTMIGYGRGVTDNCYVEDFPTYGSNIDSPYVNADGGVINYVNCLVEGATINLSGTVSFGGFFGADTYNHWRNTFLNCDVKDLNVTCAEGDGVYTVGGFMSAKAGGYSADAITDCDVTGSITSYGTNPDSTFGGFMGGIWGRSAGAVDCTAGVTINVETGTVGGFIGSLSQYSASMNYTFDGCTASGDVKTEEGTAAGFLGTAAGNNLNLTIQDCSVENTKAGLIGNVTSTTGEVKLSGNNVEAVGGNSDLVEVPVASIGDTSYFTLQEAVNVGGDIKLLADITLTSACADHFVVDGKEVTIDLNGHTVTGSGCDGVFQAINDATLTLKDSSADQTGAVVALKCEHNYAMAVWAKGATVNIAGGTYTQGDGDYTGETYNMIYASANEGVGATINITGGKFEAKETSLTLNIKDDDRETTQIVVTGGTFVGFNPSDNEAEGEGTNFCPAAYEGVVDGSGTYTVKQTKLIISNLDELKAFRDAVNAGNTFEGVTVLLAADIDLGNEKWTPIGGTTYPYTDANGKEQTGHRVFSGTFDGQGHTISNLSINQPDNSRQGLFGCAGGATFKNLTIHNANVTGNSSVAVLVGHGDHNGVETKGHVFENIKITGLVKVSAVCGTGTIVGTAPNVGITASNITVDVEAGSIVDSTRNITEDAPAGYYYSYTGGVFGQVWGSSFTNITSNIDVIGVSSGTGGITGGATGTWKNITHTGNVTIAGEKDMGYYYTNKDENGNAYGLVYWYQPSGLISGYHGGVTFENCVSTGTLTYVEDGTNTNDIYYNATIINPETRETIETVTLCDSRFGASRWSNDNTITVIDYAELGEDGEVVPVYVAESSGYYFTSVQDAIDFAHSYNLMTITLLDDVVERGIKVAAGQVALTINLKGHTIYGDIYNEGTLILTNGTIKGTRFVSAIESYGPDADLKIENMTVISYRHALRIEGGGATIQSGTFQTLGKVDGDSDCHALNAGGAYATSVTIENGTFIGPKGSKNTDSADSGSAVQAQARATVTIKGGTFSNGQNNTLNAIDKGYIKVTGGLYDQDPTAYAAEGYMAQAAETEGWYNVVKAVATVTTADGTVTNYASLAEAVAATVGGDTVNILAAGTYVWDASWKIQNKAVTFTGVKDTVIDMTNVATGQNTSGATLNFKGVTVKFGNANYKGFQHAAKVTYTDCTIEGTQFLYAPEAAFTNCTFKVTGDAYAVWTYGAKDVTFTNCEFNTDGKAVLVYTEAAHTAEIKVDKCTFTATTNRGKAAVELGQSANGNVASYTLNITNSTASENFVANNTESNLWGNKNSMTRNDGSSVTIDGSANLMPVAVASITVGEKVAYYVTVEAALTAAKNGQTVELLSDATMSAAVELTANDITLALGKYTLTMTGPAAVRVKGTAKLTVTGSGDIKQDNGSTIGIMFIVSGVATLNLNTTGKLDAGLTVVQAGGNAVVNINSGTLSAWSTYQDKSFVLNYMDSAIETAKINLDLGVQFVGFDPAHAQTEPAVNGVQDFSFCAEGHTSEYDEATNTYTVIVDTSVAFIGKTGYATLADAIAAAGEGDVITLKDGTHTMPGSVANKNITITGSTSTVVEMLTAVNASNSTIAFDGVTVKFDNDNYEGLQHAAKVTYTNCTHIGTEFLYAPEVSYTGCTFEMYDAVTEYAVWTYGASDVKFNDCEFNTNGKAILVYTEKAHEAAIALTDCSFTSNGTFTGKAAVELGASADGSNSDYDLSFTNCTADEKFVANNSTSNLWGNKNSIVSNTGSSVTIDSDENLLPTAVASITNGEKVAYYVSLADAFAKATKGDTVTLLADIQLDAFLRITESITLNLNGKTITTADSFTSGGILVVGDYANSKAPEVTVTGNGSIISGGYALNVSAGKLTIENGTFKGVDTAVQIQRGELVINGGHYESTSDDSTYVINKLDKYATESTVSINGGSFKDFNPSCNAAEGKHTNFAKEGYIGKADENGVYTLVVGTNVVVDKAVDATCTTTGLTEGSHCGVCGKVLVAQEVVDALEHKYTYTNNGENHTKTCSIGGETVTEEHSYIDGKCVCGAEEVTTVYVAQIGETKYETLAEAFDAANVAGGTVKLLADAELAETITVTNTVTLDLNGHNIQSTITTKDSYMFVINGGDLTVKGEGEVACVADYETKNARIFNVKSGALTIASGSYEGRVVILAAKTGTTIRVTGGTLNGSYVAITGPNNTTVEDCEITGGSFIAWDPTTYVPEGYEVTSTDEAGVTVYTVVKSEETELTVEFAGTTLDVGNSLDINFYITKATIDADLMAVDGYYVLITRSYANGTADDVVRFKSSEWEDHPYGYGVTYNKIAGAQMCDTMTVQVFYADGTPASEVKTDGVREYVMRNFDKQNDKTKHLFADMLNYGAAAQEFFKYGQDDLANSQLTDAQKAYATERVTMTDNRVSHDLYAGSTLNLESRIEMAVYFKDITAEMAATMSAKYSFVSISTGETVEVNVPAGELKHYSGNIWGVMLDELAVANAGQLVEVTLYNADGTAYGTVKDSVESYIARMSGTDALYEAIMKFATSAKDYFAK